MKTKNTLHDPRGDEILAIEYRRKRPFSVWTGATSYDFDYSRRVGGMVYAMSGFGAVLGPEHDRQLWLAGFVEPERMLGRVWLAPGVRAVRSRRYGRGWGRAPATPEDLRRMGYALLAAPDGNPFDDASEKP